MNKHFIQIRKGGVKVIAKKLKSLFYLLLQTPIYLISIPLIIILRLIKPWYLIRWEELVSSRIGHFSVNTELYCCKRDARINTPSQKYLDVFYLKKYACNKQMEKMWRRKLIILPRWLLFPLFIVNRFISRFVSGGNCHEIGNNADSDLDVYNLIQQSKAHINFTYDEKVKGKNLLTKLGVPQDAKFVCLNVRDSGYLNKYKKSTLRDWSYHNYRDGDIDKYVLAAEELARRGYYVFRMGINVLKPLISSNPKVIDYANSKIRSDFMDIYLGAKCRFCISTSSGFDGIPTIFRKPIAFTCHVPFGNFAYLRKSNKGTLVLTKHHINKKNRKKLTISEIFSANVAFANTSDKYKLNDIELEENSPEEIRDFVIEMDERLNGHWKDTNEDLLLQKRFWSIFEDRIKSFEDRIKRLNLKPVHWKTKLRYGTKFLRENKNWIR